LENGNVTAACGSLGAFENQVQAKIGKTLTAAEGAALITAANQMQAASGCGAHAGIMLSWSRTKESRCS